jgi:hypothetical protein
MAALMLGNKGSAEMYSETGPDSVRTKAEIVEYVKGSFAALHQAVARIDGKNAAEPGGIGDQLAEDAAFLRGGCRGAFF